MNSQEKIRILIAKPGLDGHDRGAKIVARADIQYKDIKNIIEKTLVEMKIVSVALQEDVDLIGLSLLSGAHIPLFQKVLELLKENKAEDITVTGGGIIPQEDIPKLKEAGIREMSLPGTPLESIINWTNANVKPRHYTEV